MDRGRLRDFSRPGLWLGLWVLGLVLCVALVLIALGLVFVAAEMPSRTTAGAGVLSGLQALSSTLLTQPTNQLPKGREQEQLALILPYAVVLGGADRWLQAIAVGADHEIMTENTFEDLIATEPDLGRRVFRVDAKQDKPIFITKAVAYHTSRGVPVRELFDRCRRTLDRARENGSAAVFAQQRAWLDDFWERSDVEIEGRPGLQQSVRWNLFQLIDQFRNIAALAGASEVTAKVRQHQRSLFIPVNHTRP